MTVVTAAEQAGGATRLDKGSFPGWPNERNQAKPLQAQGAWDAYRCGLHSYSAQASEILLGPLSLLRRLRSTVPEVTMIHGGEEQQRRRRSRPGSRRGAQGERRLAVVVIALFLGDGVQQAASHEWDGMRARRIPRLAD